MFYRSEIKQHEMEVVEGRGFMFPVFCCCFLNIQVKGLPLLMSPRNTPEELSIFSPGYMRSFPPSEDQTEECVCRTAWMEVVKCSREIESKGHFRAGQKQLV